MAFGYSYNRRGGYSKRTTPYRSGFEDKVTTVLKNASVPFEYEKYKIEYSIPSTEHTYTPDIVLSNNIIIEIKGLFETADRQKHVLIKQQHPNLDIRFLFQNANNAIYKGSKTTYATWCEKYGFKYANKELPLSWLKEPKKDAKGLIKK